VILLDTAARPIIAHRAIARMHLRHAASVQRGLAAGADALELDVRITRDGHAVVIHDETVDRTTNGIGRCSQHEARPNCANSTPAAGERIPLLSKCSNSFRSTPIIVELQVDEALIRRWTWCGGDMARATCRLWFVSSSALEPARAAGVFTAASRRDWLDCCLPPHCRGAPRAVPFQTVTMPPSYYGIPLPVAAMCENERSGSCMDR